MMFQNLSLKAKLVWAFSLLASLVIALSALSYRDLAEDLSDFQDFVNGVNTRAQLSSEYRAAIDRRAVAARNLVLTTNAAEKETEKNIATQANQAAQEALGQLVKAAQSPSVPPEVKALIADIEKLESTYQPVALNIVALGVQDRRDEAIAQINKECKPLLAALVGKTNEYQVLTKQRIQKIVEDSESGFAHQIGILIAFVLAAITLAGLTGFFITRSVHKSLGADPKALGDAAHKVAFGDLSRVHGALAAPEGSVLESLAVMQQNLSRIVSKVRDATDSIATGTGEISQGNNDLSARTEQQASALQETAATMEEFSSTIRHNADNSKLADQLALTASNVATQGGEVVSKVVITMKDINDSSRKISDIIGVIDGIAFQTNILALNAAVEAARAGEQGRGFAVVATEVRNLAQRSAAAAKEIKTLINESVEKVALGSTLVDQAGQTMQEVVGAIQRVSDIVTQISSASSEQSSGVNQIGQAVNQLDQTTQQNAALVEEAAAAAKSLDYQAQQLIEAVRAFKLDAPATDAASPPSQYSAHAPSRTGMALGQRTVPSLT